VGKPSLYAAQPYAKAEGSVSSGTAYPGCPGTKAVKRLLLLLVKLGISFGNMIHCCVCTVSASQKVVGVWFDILAKSATKLVM